MSASWWTAPCPATATAPECCGFAPHCVQKGAFEAGSGAPPEPVSPPPLFPLDWLESLLPPPPQAVMAAKAKTMTQLCRMRFMAGPRGLRIAAREAHLLGK